MATFSDQANGIDTWFFDGSGNQGSSATLQIGEPNDAASVTRRTLIKWDLSSIPTNATVTSAVLSLWTVTDIATNTRIWSAYRVLRNWVVGEATWDIYSTGNSWGTAGCSNTTTDREATDIGTVEVAGDRALGEVQITLTASKVQEWISGALANYGVLLQAAGETDDMWIMDSTQGSTPGQRPKLVINYTTPTVSSGYAFFM